MPIQQKTLDLLDADLRGHAERYYSLPYDDRYAFFSHKSKNLRIDPNWSSQKFPETEQFNFDWQEVKYSDHPDFDTLLRNDERIGIYIFWVKPPNTILDMPKYVMYVGISGERGSNRALKDRLKEYFYINKLKLRKNVHKMLQLYYEYTYISFSLLENNYEEIERLEVCLHEFFSPLYNTRDFEPPTKAARSAWN